MSAHPIPLTPSLTALLLFAAWTFLLLLWIALLRLRVTLAGERRANAFSPAGDDVSAFSGRLCRAHANCVENLPVFAAVILVAHLSGQAAITDPLALWALAARLVQSVTHLISTRVRAVLLRFAAMLVQMGLLAFWFMQLMLGGPAAAL